jgi:hypothetical protein
MPDGRCRVAATRSGTSRISAESSPSKTFEPTSTVIDRSGVLAQGEAQNTKVGRLFLDAAGIGNHSRRTAHQPEEGDVAQRLERTYSTATGQDADPRQADPRARMDREENRELLRYGFQGAHRLGEQRRVDERRAVQRHEDVLSTRDALSSGSAELFDVRPRRDQGVDHHVAHVMNRPPIRALGDQIVRRLGRMNDRNRDN